MNDFAYTICSHGQRPDHWSRPLRGRIAFRVAAARSDPDAQPLTVRKLKEMVPMQVLRGRPKSQTAKQLISVRYSPEVIAYFRSTGEGWQSRMDDVLRKYLEKKECNS